MKSSEQNEGKIANETTRRRVSLMKFEKLRARTMPFAKARGYLTDEDVLISDAK